MSLENKDGGFTPPKTTPVPNPVRVDLPKEPPKEVLSQSFEMPEGMLADSGETKVTVTDKSGNVIPPVPEKKEEPPKVEAPPKVEEKKEEPPKPSVLKAPASKDKKEEGKEAIKPIVPPSKDKRDLTGFTTEEQTVLRQMSNEAFEFTSKLLKEQKELQKIKSDTFLQHPDAYTLSPQFKELQKTAILSQREGDYWQACLEQLDAGKPIQDLVGWNEDGTPKLGSEYQPTRRIEELVRLAMNKAYTTAQKTGDELKTIPEKFKSEVNNTLRAVQEERAKRFSWVADPKLLDYTIDIEGRGDVAIKQIREEFISLFPPYMRNAATDVAADLMVALQIQSAELRNASVGKSIAEEKQEELKRGEPKSSVKPGEQRKPVGGVSEFTISGMPTM